MSRKIKRNFIRKKKTLFFFRLYTYKALLSSRRDRSRLRLLQSFLLSVTSVPSLSPLPCKRT